MSNEDHHSLESHAKHVLVRQAALAVFLVLLLLAGEYFVGNGARTTENPIAGIYGVMLGMLGTLIAWRSASRTGKAALKMPQLALVPVYVGLLNRLLVVGGGLALGMIVLELKPLMTVVGYLVSQLAFVGGWERRA